MQEFSVADLVAELKILRKGRGVATARLGDRTGSALRTVCRISVEDGPAEMREKLAERLHELTGKLPHDLCTAVLAALGLHADAQSTFYQERVRWLAHALQRHDRTIRRRVDEGITRLAELAVAGPRTSGDPEWHTEKGWLALALDRPVPEVLIVRRIVADRDGVSEVDISIAGEIDVFHGGTLAGRTVMLPRPLRRGERHEVALRARVELPSPHWVWVPRRPCDLLDLHLRFGADRPVEVTLIDRVPGGATPSGPPVPLDRAGEAHIRFRHLTPGFAYGATWS